MVRVDACLRAFAGVLSILSDVVTREAVVMCEVLVAQGV